MDRRTFAKGALAAATLSAAPAIVRGRNLNSRLQLASIGSDGKGFSDIQAVSSHEYQQYVAFCDVDLDRTLKVKELSPETPIYQDFREMLVQMEDKIDAVTVSTPDHMHAYCAIMAMNRGMHVYCQKPLTHNVWEARELVKAAQRTGVTTRMGNQIHSHQFYRTAVDIVRSGRIGKVKEVHFWVPSPGHGKSQHLNRPAKEDPVPDSLDWDLWVGVAPMRPYSAAHRCYHPFGWRDWQDFGNGAVGDFGPHVLDPVYTALGITGPGDEFVASHSGMNDEVWPAQTTYRYTVPGTEYTAGDRLTITWNDGGQLPNKRNSHLPEREELPRGGSMMIGETGTLVTPHVAEPRLYLEDGSYGEYEMLEALDHYHGWVDACILGEQPSANFEYGGLITETILLANIAVRFPGESMRWDAENLRITSHEEANPWLTREYREGWDIKELIG